MRFLAFGGIFIRSEETDYGVLVTFIIGRVTVWAVGMKYAELFNNAKLEEAGFRTINRNLQADIDTTKETKESWDRYLENTLADKRLGRESFVIDHEYVLRCAKRVAARTMAEQQIEIGRLNLEESKKSIEVARISIEEGKRVKVPRRQCLLGFIAS